MAVKASGGIFFAESDRPWVLDGANVHVSMVGFDNGTEAQRVLDGKQVAAINANLAGDTDTGAARPLGANAGLSSIGASMHGPFALAFVAANDRGRRNAAAEPPPVGLKIASCTPNHGHRLSSLRGTEAAVHEISALTAEIS